LNWSNLGIDSSREKLTRSTNDIQGKMNLIIEYCENCKPSLIYLAIGCATNPLQQCPPFVSSWPGLKICILIDPMLESPPNYFKVAESKEGPTVIGDTIFFIERRNFERPSPPGIDPRWAKDPQLSASDMAFLSVLCNLAGPNTQFICQDYTGAIITELYPNNPSQKILDNVLFDVTYNEGGCFIDFDKVVILRNPDGSFLHPEFEPLANLLRNTTLLQAFKKKRKSPLCYYIHRLYAVMNGSKEPRDWCSPEAVLHHMKPLCQIYKTPFNADKQSIRALLKAALLDFCAASNQYMSEPDIDEVIEKPDQYTETLSMLCLEEI